MNDENATAMLRALRFTLLSVRRAYENDEPKVLHTILEDVQPVVDAVMAWHQREIRRHEQRGADLRHEAALARLSAIRAALLDATGSAPAITDPPDVWSRAIRAAIEGRS